MTWSKLATINTPSARAGHSANVISSGNSHGNKVFVFGGGDGDDYLNDAHILDLGILLTVFIVTYCIA